MSDVIKAEEPKSPVLSKINIIAFFAILLPYINTWLTQTLGAPVLIEPTMAYDVIFGAIIVIRTLWTQGATTWNTQLKKA